LYSGSNYLSQIDVTASTKLKNWLGWQITSSDRYITNPPIELKGNDQLLSTGLRLSFGSSKKANSTQGMQRERKQLQWSPHERLG
jgi:hypothetical protein